MKTTLEALQSLYVKNGGALTDTFEDIAGGIPVGDYTVIPDMVEALAQLELGGGGGGGDSDILKVVYNANDNTYSVTPAEAYNALCAGKMVALYYDQSYEDDIQLYFFGWLTYPVSNGTSGEGWQAVSVQFPNMNSSTTYVNVWGLYKEEGQTEMRWKIDTAYYIETGLAD